MAIASKDDGTNADTVTFLYDTQVDYVREQWILTSRSEIQLLLHGARQVGKTRILEHLRSAVSAGQPPIECPQILRGTEIANHGINITDSENRIVHLIDDIDVALTPDGIAQIKNAIKRGLGSRRLPVVVTSRRSGADLARRALEIEEQSGQHSPECSLWFSHFAIERVNPWFAQASEVRANHIKKVLNASEMGSEVCQTIIKLVEELTGGHPALFGPSVRRLLEWRAGHQSWIAAPAPWGRHGVNDEAFRTQMERYLFQTARLLVERGMAELSDDQQTRMISSATEGGVCATNSLRESYKFLETGLVCEEEDGSLRVVGGLIQGIVARLRLQGRPSADSNPGSYSVAPNSAGSRSGVLSWRDENGELRQHPFKGAMWGVIRVLATAEHGRWVDTESLRSAAELGTADVLRNTLSRANRLLARIDCPLKIENLKGTGYRLARAEQKTSGSKGK